MKHKLLFSILLLFSYLGVSAQIYLGNPHDFNRSLVQRVNMDQEKVLETGISSRTIERNEYGEDGQLKKSSIWYRYFYNENGQITREENYNNRGKLYLAYEYSYNEKHQVTERRTYRRKSATPFHTVKINYFNDSLISTISSTNKKKKETWGYKYFYNNQNLISEQRSYDKGKLDGRIEYDYYPDRSKKEVRYYDDSLKLDKTFRYDCGIGNSLLSQKQKDTLTRCSKKEELADGTIRTIEETRDEKGRIIRTIYDYNEKEHWSETKSYDEKNRLVYTARWEKLEDGRVKTTWSRYRKGKLKHTYLFHSWKDNFGFESNESLEKEKVESSYFSTYTFFLKK